MKPSAEEKRVELLLKIADDACKSASAQYDDYYKSFTGLDGKAQAAATVAGVVMGAVFAFFNSARLQAFLNGEDACMRLLAIAPAAMALLTAILGVFATFVRTAPTPLAPEDQTKELNDLARLPPDRMSNERVLRYYQGRLAYTMQALETIKQHVNQKAWVVTMAQCALLVTLALLLWLFVEMAYAVETPP